jgi:N-acetylglucosaminyl-diphospho-decaprenol L-rhamnosyltransferase
LNQVVEQNININDKESILDITIIIVSFNTKELTHKCLSLVYKYAKDINYEIVVVDNASSDGSAEMIAREFPHARLIILPENRGFAGGNNPGMKIARGRYILLLNSDAFLEQDALNKTILYMEQHHEIGILGCKLTNPDGSLQPSARMLPSPINKLLVLTGLAHRYPKSRFFGRVDLSWWDHSEPKSVGWVVGAFFLIRRETIKDIGYLDERYFLYFEEVDYCISARRKGWDVVFYPFTQIVHLGGQSAVKSVNKISKKGTQIISIRLSSEYKYYRKIYGLFRTICSASIEYFWNLIILIKNLLLRSEQSEHKKNMAKLTMGLIVSTLKKEKFGKWVPGSDLY